MDLAHSMRRTPRVILLLAIQLSLIAACGGDDDAGSTDSLLTSLPSPFAGSQVADTYVGQPAGSQFLIAVVSRGTEAAGYACDAATDAWLTGTTNGDSVMLEGEGPTGTVTVTFSTATGEGVLRVPGSADSAFTARAPAAPEGLYRLDDEAGLRGWIRFEDEARGLLRRRRGGGSSPSPTPPPPPPPGSMDPCAGIGATSGTATNPGACSNAICDTASRDFAAATTQAERQSAENRAAAEGCILNPFADLPQP